MSRIDHIAGHTWHGRKGDIANAFRYGVDFVLLDAEAGADTLDAPRWFGRNRRGLISVQDRDVGGTPKQGRGAAWVREVLMAEGADPGGRIDLLTQPRVLGHVFNPITLWLCHDPDGGLRVVIAEVTNTFGDRHSYLCRKADGKVITPEDRISATKIFHVSPFQPVAGDYTFRFDFAPTRIGVWIDYRHGNHGGLTATLIGKRKPMRTRGMVAACLRRPFGSRRVLALIHWQALKLWWKGARFYSRPSSPKAEVSS